MVFNSSGSKILNNSFHFELFKERIPPCESLKFLGITFDLSLSFNQHIKEIKKKCINRLNIIKMMSSKRYELNKSTLTTIYLSLIRSIMDYSSLIIPQKPRQNNSEYTKYCNWNYLQTQIWYTHRWNS